METTQNLLETLLRNCLEVVSEISGPASEMSAENYLKQMGFFSKDAHCQNMVFGILDMKSLSYRYIANTELALGIASDEFLEKGFSTYFRSMVKDKSNITVVPSLLKFLIDSVNLAPLEIRKDFIAYAFGMQHMHPSGKPFTTLAQLFGLEFDEHDYPSLCFFIVQDVSHLVKNIQQIWGRISFNTNEFVTTFSSKETGKPKADIFSERETDVLKLLLKGQESKQIAEKLFISSNTVDNHRKNMIRKLDARDTTALVQLSKLLGILK
ncbi:regulatory protein, luxR family [Pseudarcicella hirudinis]|uniref:Regulatory protein, luxR family n=1 Tax=Pseudarcicella hirudinis TaxID=1079859 RepID=A0A1I5RQT4_9BACT|nr:LuxR C-terminal-related transcriptional regulator [Pseudarcicella hirudinis]SFP60914.1 regulatory protein, luxR family [Pseudarcicella hirudinis]